MTKWKNADTKASYLKLYLKLMIKKNQFRRRPIAIINNNKIVQSILSKMKI